MAAAVLGRTGLAVKRPVQGRTARRLGQPQSARYRARLVSTESMRWFCAILLVSDPEIMYYDLTVPLFVRLKVELGGELCVP